jgi:hypothetical protein
MAIGTYAQLQTAIDNWLKLNGNAAYTDRIPEWITLAESEINRTLRTFRNESDAASNYLTTDTDRLVALPSGFIEMLGVDTRYATETDASLREVKYATPANLERYIASEQRLPRLYAIIGSNLEFDAYPDAAAVVNVHYLSRYDIATDTTNWLLTNHPDAYLYGALACGHDYRWNGPKRDELYARFRQVLEQINMVDERSRAHAELSVDEVGRMSGRGTFDIVTGRYL